MRLPLERGPVSAAVVAALAEGSAADERALVALVDRLVSRTATGQARR